MLVLLKLELENDMKKLFALLLAIVMVVGLCACTFDSQADFAKRKESERRYVPEKVEELQDEYDALVNTITDAANCAFIEKYGGQVLDSFIEIGYNKTLGYYAFHYNRWYDDANNREHYIVTAFADAESVYAAFSVNEAENVESAISTFQKYWSGVELTINEYELLEIAE